MSKVSTLTDLFNGGSLAAKWTNDGSVSVNANVLSVTTTGVHSTATYDATSSSAYVQVTRHASGGTTAPVTNLVFASATSGTALKIIRDSSTSQISFQSQVGFSDGSPVSIFYHPIDHAFWQIVESGGTTYFQTSPMPDTLGNFNWTTRRSITSPVWMNSVTVYLSVDNTPTVGAIFANFNAVSPTNWYIRLTGSDNNGGTSASVTPDQSGTDGVGVGTVTWTAASAHFTVADINKGINIAGILYRVYSVNSSTSLIVDANVPSATGQTWKLGGALRTFTKLLSTGKATAIQSGDNVYVGGGTYREIPAWVTSGWLNYVNFIGDVDGAKTGDSGEVMLTAFTTNDTTVASSNPLITPAHSYVTFQKMTMIGGTTSPRFVNSTDYYGLWFVDCTFIGLSGNNVGMMSCSPTTPTYHGICFERCRWLTSGPISVTLPTSTPNEWEYGLYVRNCVMDIHGTAIDVTASGALAHKGGGVYVINSTIRSSSGPSIRTNSANNSTTFPMLIEGCLIIAAFNSTGITANTSGQIVEDYNIISAATPRTNVSVGAHSISDGSRAIIPHIGQEQIAGYSIRPYLYPTAGSPLLGFGASAKAPLVDIQGTLRPAGGRSASYAVGAYERTNTAVRSTAQTHSGTYSLLLTGPGVQDFDLDVNATSTTVTAWLWYSSGYIGANPQISVINGTECGVVNNSVSASGTTNAWQQVSLTFTPTSKGRVTIRFISNDTSGTGLVYIDDVAVT